MSQDESGRAVSNVSLSNSGGVREREKETKEGCAVREGGRGRKRKVKKLYIRYC